jgi:hypothetical protein
MKKKVLLFSILVIFLILVLPSIIAGETEDINKSYACLEGKVKDKCSSLSSEEKIFSLLAIGECKDEVISDPKYKTDLKSTAQAVLALDKAHADTTEAETWLFSQNATPSNIIWYLEIESLEATNCTITYSNSSYPIKIGSDKKINQGAGSCLSLSDGSWWLKISSSCYTQEFEVSCDKGFLTTLLYKKPLSSAIYVSEDTNSASAGGTTKEKVNSFCFKQGSSCDYEGSLWTALVLNYLGHDVSSYLPYLVTMADETENIKYLPDAFLYYITTHTNFRANLLGQQKSGGWWLESGDKFYDTALALFPFQYEEPTEKTNAKTWLLGAQNTDGCWQGNIRNTAFVLYSIWPKGLPSNGNGNGNGVDCEDAGYYCMSSIGCGEAGGDELDNYSCFGVNICCDEPPVLNECVADLSGEICSSSEDCAGGDWEDASDLDYGQRCCVGGTCEDSDDLDCEYYGGTCRTSCEEDEQETTDECEYTGDVCCEEKSTPPISSYWWLWTLLGLIVLTVVGIIFRDKLRPFWFKIRSKFKKSRPSKPGFHLPPKTTRRVMPRRILPHARGPARHAPARKPSGEIDDVLKKLKEMGK